MSAGFVDEVNPTPDELRGWAYSPDAEPMQDFDLVVAEPAMLPTLIDVVGDASCPKRDYLLGSLYCVVGHSALDDPRLRAAVDAALATDDPWLHTWATRTAHVLDDPTSRNRDDWCNEDGLRTRPT
jgi:hypothetical protein